jgi:hypothetical protein
MDQGGTVGVPDFTLSRIQQLYPIQSMVVQGKSSMLREKGHRRQRDTVVANVSNDVTISTITSAGGHAGQSQTTDNRAQVIGVTVEFRAKHTNVILGVESSGGLFYVNLLYYAPPIAVDRPREPPSYSASRTAFVLPSLMTSENPRVSD